MKAVALCLALGVTASGLARADEPQRLELKGQFPDYRLRHRAAYALLGASGLFATLGLTFVGLAKHANDNLFADMTYHPREADRRLSFEIGDAFFFTFAVITLAPGIVLLCDR